MQKSVNLQTLRNYIFAILKDITLKRAHLTNSKVVIPLVPLNFRYLLYIKNLKLS